MSGQSLSPSAPVLRVDHDQWLWCLHCHRFFQGHQARPDPDGGLHACAFAGCDGAGYGVDIHPWDAWPRQNPDVRDRWPARDALRTGLSVDPWADADGEDTLDPTDPWAPDDPPRPAPNRDGRRIEALLGPIFLDRIGDITPFRGLDVTGLARLIDEGFVVPDGRPCGGPTPLECLSFLRRWPQAWAQGHLAAPSRMDYGVAITGIECTVRRVPRALRGALREAFVSSFGRVGALYCDPVELTAWWG